MKPKLPKGDAGKQIKKARVLGRIATIIFSNPVTTIIFFVVIAIIIAICCYTVYQMNNYLLQLEKQYTSLTARQEESGSQFNKRLFFITRNADGTVSITIGYKNEEAMQTSQDILEDNENNPDPTIVDGEFESVDYAAARQKMAEVLAAKGVPITQAKLDSIAYLYQAMYVEGPYGYDFTMAVIGRSLVEGTPGRLEGSDHASSRNTCPQCGQHSYLIGSVPSVHGDYTAGLTSADIHNWHTLYESCGGNVNGLSQSQINTLYGLSSRNPNTGFGIGSIQMSTNGARTATFAALSTFYQDGVLTSDEIIAADLAGLTNWIGPTDFTSPAGYASLDDYCGRIAAQIHRGKGCSASARDPYGADVVAALYPAMCKPGGQHQF